MPKDPGAKLCGVGGHLLMLGALAGHDLLAASYAEALRTGYRWHEFGDVHLILPGG